MGTTGLIYAAIVAVWAAYLVPLWLRRHDEESARSAERFSSAMRVLAKRQQTAAAGESTLGSWQVNRSGDSGVWDDGEDGIEPGPYEFADSGPSPATRRRRVLVTMLAVSTVFAGLAAINVVPWWMWYVSLVVAGGFVGMSAWIATGERATAAARFERFQQYRDEVTYVDADGTMRSEVPASTSTSTAASASDGSVTATHSAEHPAASGPGESTGEDSVVAVLPDDFGKAPQVREDGTWDPVEVPLPTYVTKDPAPRTGRKIEIGDAPGHRSLLDETEAGQPATTGIRDELYDREQTGDFDDLRAANDY